jgi:hypothetical protein
MLTCLAKGVEMFLEREGVVDTLKALPIYILVDLRSDVMAITIPLSTHIKTSPEKFIWCGWSRNGSQITPPAVLLVPCLYRLSR